MSFTGKFLLPFSAGIITVMAISYSACHESKADAANDTLTAFVNKDFHRYEEKINEMTRLHEEQVKNYTDDVGMTSNSEALALIQSHKVLLEKHQSRLDYHRLQLLHGDTTDVVKTTKMQNELKVDLETITKEIEKMSADAAANTNLNIRK